MHGTYRVARTIGGHMAMAPRRALAGPPAAPTHFSLDISLPLRYGTRGTEGGRNAGAERGGPPAVCRPGGEAGRAGPDPRGGDELRRPEPDGAGPHGVRTAGVDAPPGHAEGPGGPRVPGGPGGPRAAHPAGQAAGPAGRGADRGPGDAPGRPGRPAHRDGGRPRPDHAGGGADPRAARPVPGTGGAVPLPRARGALRGVPALPGLPGPPAPGGGPPAVLEPARAAGGPGPLDRLGRRDPAPEPPADREQQPLPPP